MRASSSLAITAVGAALLLSLSPSCGGSGSPTSASSGAGGQDAGPPPPTPGADTTVTPFDQTHIYFTGSENMRVVDVEATFPDEGAYESILLHLSLSCPTGGCDAWDRFATIGVVTQKGATPEEDQVIELARYITPYKVKADWDIDVTSLRPLLRGKVTLRAFIDTWVGPGSPYGAGWLVTTSFTMKGGIPAKLPISVTPIISPRYVAYGDPNKPIDGSVPAADVMLGEASSYELRTFVTGHGQGNAGNCAEFCKRTHTMTVNGAAHDQLIWRADCATTAVPNQQGTWKYPRAGWCPGADVLPWTIDVTADLANGKSATITYGVEAYDNTCRPDAPTCTGCTLGTGCDYDGGAHTEPNYQLSSVLIAYQ